MQGFKFFHFSLSLWAPWSSVVHVVKIMHRVIFQHKAMWNWWLDRFSRYETRRRVAFKQVSVLRAPLYMCFLAFSCVTGTRPILTSYFGDCVKWPCFVEAEVVAKVFRLKLAQFVEHVFEANWQNSTANGFVFGDDFFLRTWKLSFLCFLHRLNFPWFYGLMLETNWCLLRGQLPLKCEQPRSTHR